MVLNPIVVRGPRRRGVGDGRIYRGIIRFRSHLNGPGVGRRRVDAVVIQFRSRVTGLGAEESAPYARPPIRRVVWASAGTTTNSARRLRVVAHDHQFSVSFARRPGGVSNRRHNPRRQFEQIPKLARGLGRHIVQRQCPFRLLATHRRHHDAIDPARRHQVEV